jgi:hypothetical protein
MSEGHLAPALTEEQIGRIVQVMADSFGRNQLSSSRTRGMTWCP